MIKRLITYLLFSVFGITNIYSYSPKIDLDADFTKDELRVVAVTTQGLFSESDTLTIDFSAYTDFDWCYPLTTGKVISPYGGKRHHGGIDIKSFAGDTIYAAFSGRVRFSNRYFAYGNAIVVRHHFGLETLYGHNSKNLVKVGDWVVAGQPIAIVGRTGRATTEHCHFETRINGKCYNPCMFFNTTDRQLKSHIFKIHKSGRIVKNEVASH